MSLLQRSTIISSLLTAMIALCIFGGHLNSSAQTPTLLSVSTSSARLELPLNANITQQLNAASIAAVQLATPAQHQAQGMVYPRWLSDAAFSIKNRPQQRRSILIDVRRANPEASTELLLAFISAGSTTYRPLNLIFDQKIPDLAQASRTPPLPLPSARREESALDNARPSNSAKATIVRAVPPVMPEQVAPMRELTIATKRGAADEMTDFKVQGKPAPLIKSPINNKIKARASVKTPSESIPITAAPVAPTAPDTPAAAPASAPLVTPVQKVRPFVPDPATSFGDAPYESVFLAIGLLLIAALLYMIYRIIHGRQPPRSGDARREPTSQRAKSKEPAANTVFGVSEEEAHAMHAKWLRDQTLTK